MRCYNATVRTARTLLTLLGACLAIIGAACFLLETLMQSDWLGPCRGLNWPVGRSAEAIHLPDGRYAIAVDSVARIQMYSADGRFEYGWPSHWHQNILRLSPDGHLHAYSRTRDRRRGPYAMDHRVFDASGALLSQTTEPREKNMPEDSLPGTRPVPITLPGAPPAWLIFPLLHPVYAFATLFAGALLFKRKNLFLARPHLDGWRTRVKAPEPIRSAR
jgi:hypothetical protein